MSQSATLYSISREDFETIKNQPGPFDIPRFSKGYETFEQSFLGLEFVLMKTNHSSREMLSEIFNPLQSIGASAEIDFEALSEEELLETFENHPSIPYLTPDKIQAIDHILRDLSDKDILSNYEAAELNKNDIYPGVWNDLESEDNAFNKRHLIEDLYKLKNLFGSAAKDNDYLFIFIG